MSQEWLDDLASLGTDWHKEFLEVAPALIAVFSVEYEKEGDRIRKNYYVKESVGLAVGFLIAAIHNAGLVSLTHIPSPMHFLQEILNRPPQRTTIRSDPSWLSGRERHRAEQTAQEARRNLRLAVNVLEPLI